MNLLHIHFYECGLIQFNSLGSTVQGYLFYNWVNCSRQQTCNWIVAPEWPLLSHTFCFQSTSERRFVQHVSQHVNASFMHLKEITNQQNTTKEHTACSTAAVMTKEGQLLAVSADTQGGARDVRKHSLLGNGCLSEVSSSSVIIVIIFTGYMSFYGLQ